MGKKKAYKKFRKIFKNVLSYKKFRKIFKNVLSYYIIQRIPF